MSLVPCLYNTVSKRQQETSVEAGGHALGLHCVLLTKCSINSWARWCIPGPKWWILHYCSQVLKHRIFIQILIASVCIQTTNILGLMKPSHLIHTSSVLPQIFCQLSSYQHLVLIPTLRCSGKKTHATHHHQIPPSALLSTSKLCDAFLPANKKNFWQKT